MGGGSTTYQAGGGAAKIVWHYKNVGFLEVLGSKNLKFKFVGSKGCNQSNAGDP